MSEIVGWTRVSYDWSMAFKATINDIIQSQVIARVRYIKVLTGSVFLYLAWLSLCLSLFWELRDTGVLENFAILTLKPLIHVRILIYRT